MVPSVKGGWRQEPEFGLLSLPVIENLYVLCNIHYGFLSGFIPAMVDLLVLEYAPEAFHGGVVVAISFPTHGRLHPEPVKQQGIFPGAILAAPIRVMNQTCCRPLGGYGPQEGLADQVLRHTL